jgi:hypothetical protein
MFVSTCNRSLADLIDLVDGAEAPFSRFLALIVVTLIGVAFLHTALPSLA